LSTTITFNPDWLSPPAATIKELMDQRGWTLTEFAERMDYSIKHASELVNGPAPVTADAALRLESVLGGSAQFWLSREAQYREAVERRKANARLDAVKSWLEEIGAPEMAKRKWISGSKVAAEFMAGCLSFFGVSSVQAWRERYGELVRRSAFKGTSFEAEPGRITAWLRRAELKASEVETQPWDPVGLRESIKQLVALTTNRPDEALDRVRAICARHGVAVVVVRPLPKAPMNGATQFLSKNKAMLLLSFRTWGEDVIWFTFFHELGHLLLHSKKLVFLDAEGAGVDEEMENEANEFALNALIPHTHRNILDSLVRRDEIERFAQAIGTSPAIIIGQLRRKGMPYSHHAALVRRCVDTGAFD